MKKIKIKLPRSSLKTDMRCSPGIVMTNANKSSMNVLHALLTHARTHTHTYTHTHTHTHTHATFVQKHENTGMLCEK
jgi:hypothetical protein